METCHFSFSTVAADALAPLGARASAGIVMINSKYIHSEFDEIGTCMVKVGAWAYEFEFGFSVDAWLRFDKRFKCYLQNGALFCLGLNVLVLCN